MDLLFSKRQQNAYGPQPYSKYYYLASKSAKKNSFIFMYIHVHSALAPLVLNSVCCTTIQHVLWYSNKIIHTWAFFLFIYLKNCKHF